MIRIQSQDTHQRMASAWIRNEVGDQVGAYFYFKVTKSFQGLNSPRVRTIDITNFEKVKGGCCRCHKSTQERK